MPEGSVTVSRPGGWQGLTLGEKTVYIRLELHVIKKGEKFQIPFGRV